MAPYFVAAGHDVTGLDTSFFGGATLFEALGIATIGKDLRDLQPADIAQFDVVVHLAALSNDPIGNLDSTWTREINTDGSVKLAQLAKAAGVERFIFSSSCIMYGMSNVELVDERSPLDPQTEYARSKVLAERAIAALADDTFSPTFMRNGTVYGLSPYMRLDTVLNDLVAQAYTTGTVVVLSDGTPWRPVVHVEDIARSFLHVVQAPRELIHNEAFNNGAAHLNHRIIDLARIVARTVPGTDVQIRSSSAADQRTYKADFGKFARTFPEFAFKWDAVSGAAELYDGYRKVGLTLDDYRGPKFIRLRWLNELLEAGAIDRSLHWASLAGKRV